MGSETVNLCWPVSGARDCLGHSARELAANAAAYGHATRLVVAVDAQRPELVERVDAAVRRAGVETGVAVAVCDRECRTGFVREASGVDSEALSWAIVPNAAPGQAGDSACNHNALLLVNAGRWYVTSDDDVYARPAVLAGAEADPGAAPELTGDYLPAELRFVPDREAALAEVAPAEVDIVGLHAEALGTASVLRERPTRVLISTAGAYGDCGMRSGRAILSLDGAARRWGNDDDGYSEVRLSRELVRVAERPWLTNGTHLMGMHLAVDGRALLPPFLPNTRNSDGLFGVMVRVLYPQSATAVQAYGLLHDPPETRAFAQESLHEWHPTSAELVMGIVAAIASRVEDDDPQQRMESIGAGLERTASLRTSEFQGLIHEVWLETAVAYASILEELLEKHDERPELWADDTRTLLDNVYEMMQDPGSLFGGTGCGYAPREFQDLVERYGRLLQMWPHVWTQAAAGDLPVELLTREAR